MFWVYATIVVFTFYLTTYVGGGQKNKLRAFGWILFNGLIIFAIYYFELNLKITSHVIPLCLGILIANYYLNKSEIRKRALERQAHSKQLALKKKRADKEKSVSRDLNEINIITTKVPNLYETLPQFIWEANCYIDLAEICFTDTAWVPLLERTGQAHDQLFKYESAVGEINTLTVSYNKLVSSLFNNSYPLKDVPRFPLIEVPPSDLEVADTVGKRLQGLIYKAHCNHEFSLIYTSEKRNQIIEQGFKNIGDHLTTLTQGLQGITSILSSIEGELGREHTEMAMLERSKIEQIENANQHLIGIRKHIEG